MPGESISKKANRFLQEEALILVTPFLRLQRGRFGARIVTSNPDGTYPKF
jgi:hypothetical protein